MSAAAAAVKFPSCLFSPKNELINSSSGCKSTTAQQQTKHPSLFKLSVVSVCCLAGQVFFFPRWRSTTRRLQAPNKKGEKERKRGRRWWLDFLFFFISFSSPRLALALRRALGLWSLGCLEKFHLQRKRERESAWECVRVHESAWESVRERERAWESVGEWKMCGSRERESRLKWYRSNPENAWVEGRPGTDSCKLQL